MEDVEEEPYASIHIEKDAKARRAGTLQKSERHSALNAPQQVLAAGHEYKKLRK